MNEECKYTFTFYISLQFHNFQPKPTLGVEGGVCRPPKVLLFRKKFPNMEEEISKKNLATFPIIFFWGLQKHERERGDGGIFTIPPAPDRVKNDKKINWSQFCDLHQYQYTSRENSYQTVTNVISAANLSIKKTY